MGKVNHQGLSRRAHSLLISLGTVLILFSAACQPSEKTPDRSAEKVLVLVNGKPITYEQVDRRLRSLHGDVDLKKEDPQLARRMTEQAIDAEILDELLLQGAVKEGIKVGEEQVQRDLENTIEMMGRSGFKKMLEKRGASEEEYKDFLRDRLLISAFQENLVSDVTVSEEVLEEYYEGHPEGVQSPAEVRLHIMLGKNRGTADSFYKRAVSGEDFNALADEFRTTGGKVSRTRWMPYGSMPVAVGDLIESAATGDVIRYSDSNGDEYVVKVLEKREEGGADFEEVKDRVRSKLLQVKRQNALKDWYETQLNTVHIEYVKDE